LPNSPNTLPLTHYHLCCCRRKHNYIPVFLEAARQLARKGKLMPILADAKAKQKSRIAEAKAKQSTA
jgi:hypothetical protein